MDESCTFCNLSLRILAIFFSYFLCFRFFCKSCKFFTFRFVVEALLGVLATSSSFLSRGDPWLRKWANEPSSATLTYEFTQPPYAFSISCAPRTESSSEAASSSSSTSKWNTPLLFWRFSLARRLLISVYISPCTELPTFSRFTGFPLLFANCSLLSVGVITNSKTLGLSSYKLGRWLC